MPMAAAAVHSTSAAGSSCSPRQRPFCVLTWASDRCGALQDDRIGGVHLKIRGPAGAGCRGRRCGRAWGHLALREVWHAAAAALAAQAESQATTGARRQASCAGTKARVEQGPARLPPPLPLANTLHLTSSQRAQCMAGASSCVPSAHDACWVVNATLLDTGLATPIELMATQVTLHGWVGRAGGAGRVDGCSQPLVQAKRTASSAWLPSVSCF